MSEWQDISTAPRDRTQILLIGRAGPLNPWVYRVCEISSEGVIYGWDVLFPATHWQPLPAPPSKTEA